MTDSVECESKFDCSLCLERFRDPRILRCFHSFCRDCLKDYLQSKRCESGLSGACFECPLCRAEHVLPDGGVNGIQKNFYLEEKPEPVSKSAYPMCDKHEKEDLRFYCRTCDHNICRDCNVVEHGGHKIDMVKDVMSEVNRKSQDALNAVEKDLIKNEIEIRTCLEPEIVNAEAILSNAQKQVLVLTDEMEAFKGSMNDLLGLIKQHHQTKKKILLTIDKQFEQKRVQFNEAKQWVIRALEGNAPQSVLKLLKKLDGKLGEIKQTNDVAWPHDTADNRKVGIDKIEKEFQHTAETILQSIHEFNDRVSSFRSTVEHYESRVKDLPRSNEIDASGLATTESWEFRYCASKSDGELADGLAGVHVGFKCESDSTDSEGLDEPIIVSKSMTELLQAEAKFESGIKVSAIAESGEGEIQATKRKDTLDKELRKELRKQRIKEKNEEKMRRGRANLGIDVQFNDADEHGFGSRRNRRHKRGRERDWDGGGGRGGFGGGRGGFGRGRYRDGFGRPPSRQPYDDEMEFPQLMPEGPAGQLGRNQLEELHLLNEQSYKQDNKVIRKWLLKENSDS